jgi:glutathione synthase/RimK-type ligase-like ATP-grasp enzyme
MDTFLHNLFGIIKAKWLSNPSAVLNAENKLLQLSLAKAIGFNLPQTLLTTDKQELASFIKTNKATVIKPIGRGRVDYADNTSKLIFTNIINKNMIDEIDLLELTPAIYQEHIEKEYELRITIVGKDVFAASVDSQSDTEALVDWRRKKIKFEKYELPEDLKNKCLLLLDKLNISYGAFDFIKAKNGIYYFLEVNPNGQWVWIEKDTGQLISESIINYLSC